MYPRSFRSAWITDKKDDMLPSDKESADKVGLSTLIRAFPIMVCLAC